MREKREQRGEQTTKAEETEEDKRAEQSLNRADVKFGPGRRRRARNPVFPQATSTPPDRNPNRSGTVRFSAAVTDTGILIPGVVRFSSGTDEQNLNPPPLSTGTTVTATRALQPRDSREHATRSRSPRKKDYWTGKRRRISPSVVKDVEFEGPPSVLATLPPSYSRDFDATATPESFFSRLYRVLRGGCTIRGWLRGDERGTHWTRRAVIQYLCPVRFTEEIKFFH